MEKDKNSHAWIIVNTYAKVMNWCVLMHVECMLWDDFYFYFYFIYIYIYYRKEEVVQFFFWKCMPSCGWCGSIVNGVGQYFYFYYYYYYFLELNFFFKWIRALAWMRSTVPIFNKIRIFANPKENFEKCGPTLWMRSIVPIFTRLGFLQTLWKILKNMGPRSKWGLLSQF